MANTKNFIAKNGVSTGDGYAMPDVRPSLLLDFANSKTLDPRITFTRGSTATYWDGHTTTKAEENLIAYSQAFTSAGWFGSGSTVTDNAATAPDGTTTACSITPSTVSTARSIYFPNITVSGDNTQSLYVKANGYTKIGLRESETGAYYAAFDVASGGSVLDTSNCTATIADVGSSWYRITMTGNRSGLTRWSAYFLSPSYTSGGLTTAWSGDGTSGYYIWGAQLEQRSSVTAYTATTSSPIVKYQPTLQTAASGEARFDHDPVTGESKGLLIEEARTNSNTDSDAYGSWSSSNVYNFGDNGIAPDGTNKAQFQGIVSTTNSIYRYIDYGGSTGYRTFSIFAKDAGDVGSGYALLRIGEETSPAKRYGIIVDLSDGSVTDEESGNSPANTSYQVDNIGNGWYRIALTLNSGSTSNFRVAIAPYGNSTWSSEGGSVLTPDNAGGTVGTGVLFWGTQIEAGAFPTSYIPTSGSTVTRSAEAAYIGIDSWYPYSSGGTVIVEGRVAEVSSDNMYLEGSLNGSGIYDISVTAAQTRSQFINRYVNASNDMRSPNSTISAGELVRLVCAWSATETNSYLDGAATSSIANQSFSVGANRIYFGSRNGSSLFVNEALKRVAFYPQRLSNDTLQAMTEE